MIQFPIAKTNITSCMLLTVAKIVYSFTGFKRFSKFPQCIYFMHALHFFVVVVDNDLPLITENKS